MKRMAVWMMLVACLTIVAAPFQAEAKGQSVKLFIDNKPLELTNSPNPFVEQGRTLVPVRGVFQQLGIGVSWDQKANTATIKGNNVTIKMKPNEKEVTVNGQKKTVDRPVLMKDNRLFIPLRFVSEQTGVGVKWDQKGNTVYLTSVDKPNGNIVSDTEGFLKKVIEASENLESFSTNMDIKQKMDMFGETMNMDMKLQMDVIQNPLGLYQNMMIKMDDLDEDLSTESYFTKDGLFTFDPDYDVWVKYDDEMFEDLLGLTDMQMDPQAQFELMSKFYKNLTVYELYDAYELHFEVTNEAFQEMLDLVLGLGDLGLDDELMQELDLDLNIDHMSIVSVLDKETLHPVKDKLISKMTISADGEEMAIEQTMTSSYSKINEIDEIVIPQEVIDSAISFEEYLEMIMGDEDFDFDFDDIEDEEELDEAV